ncbi:MAG TPA: nuclear transport factor 2 family protein [Candidatus Eisenbacteria bacterium]|nr:nuclear transport factor 2 family protein [Candidatus Eisenbacteria bacterium]
MSTEEFGQRYAQAWCSQDPDQVAAFYAEDGSLTVNDGEPAVGRAAIAGVARGFMTEFPDMVVTMDRLVAKTGGHEFHWTVTGTYAANGNKVRFSGYEDWRFGSDGLVEESNGFFDADDYARQIRGGA